MIFVNHFKSSKAAKDYFTQHLAPGDYYSKDAAEMKGIWHGRGQKCSGSPAKWIRTTSSRSARTSIPRPASN